MPQEQGGDAEAEGAGVVGHGPARKFTRPQPYQKLLVFHEGQAEGGIRSPHFP